MFFMNYIRARVVSEILRSLLFVRVSAIALVVCRRYGSIYSAEMKIQGVEETRNPGPIFNVKGKPSE